MPTSATLSKFHEGIRRLLTQPEVPDDLYYHLTLVRKPSGGFQWSVQTQWCGYTEERPKREIRKGALYLGEAQRALLHQFGQLALLVNEEKDIAYFYGFGGHALILKELGDRRFKSLVEPDVCWRDSGGLGFISESSLDSSRMQHAPSKKLRMGVLTRDGRRCLICGRAPTYYVDVELHVHHAIPWTEAGLTEEENLITLCKTCHDGLEPHFDDTLVSFLRNKYPAVSTAYLEEIGEYQAWLKSCAENAAVPGEEKPNSGKSRRVKVALR